MQKQRLFSLVLLLSAYAPYTSAMLVQRDLVAELKNPTSVQIVNQVDDTLDAECSICFETMQLDSEDNPRAKLECGHKYHKTCIEDVRARGQNCPMCSQPIAYAPAAVKSQAVEPMQSIQVAQPARPIEPLQQPRPVVHEEQQVKLTERQHKILQDLIDQGLESNLGSWYIQLMCNAYTKPLVLADGDFMTALTHAQRTLVQEFIDLALDPQDSQAIGQPERNVSLYPGLNEQERALLMQIADGLKHLQRDDIDIVLIEAYTNPYVLVQNSVLTRVLSNEQKALVDYLLDCYTRRITQEIQ